MSQMIVQARIQAWEKPYCEEASVVDGVNEDEGAGVNEMEAVTEACFVVA